MQHSLRTQLAETNEVKFEFHQRYNIVIKPIKVDRAGDDFFKYLGEAVKEPVTITKYEVCIFNMAKNKLKLTMFIR